MSSKPVKVGIIGGTGVEDPKFTIISEVDVITPFGKPSDKLIHGEIGGHPVVMLPRHGRNHSIMPSNVNYRANLYALRQAGVTHILTTNACGSLQPHINRGDFVILDQYINRTYKRVSTYYDSSKEEFPGVTHVPMADPFCKHLRQILLDASKKCGATVHETGTMNVIEGPSFSTRAESKMFQATGASVIGMTTFPEAPLAKELCLSYASVGIVTDKDAWDDHDEAVTQEGVTQCFAKSLEKINKVLVEAVSMVYERTREMQKAYEDNAKTMQESKLS